MSDYAINLDRLFDLVGTVCDDGACPNDFIELDSIVRVDGGARDWYLDYCRLHSILSLELRAHRGTQAVFEQIGITPSVTGLNELDVVRTETSASPALPFLSTTLYGTVGCFSSGWPMAYLVATVIFAIGALVGSLVHVSDSVQVASQSVSLPTPLSPLPSVVGRITGMVDCRWEKNSGQWSVVSGQWKQETPIALGDKLALTSGLMEISYDTGAKVILQGPVTYEVEANGGYLAVGKLTGRLEKKVASGQWSVARESEISNPQSLISNPSLSTLHSPLFTIKTPTATITDLGTEFGVEVSEEGNTTSHVFRGLVRVRIVADGGKVQGDAQLLRENESARVEKGRDRQAIIVVSSAKAAGFVREIPRQTPKPAIKILDLADVVAGGDGFSGRRNRGINPINGQITAVEQEEKYSKGTPYPVGDGRYHRVEGLRFVDGVFVPDDRGGRPVQTDSAGHTFLGFGNSCADAPTAIWAGGRILNPSPDIVASRLGEIDYGLPGHGLLFMNGNNGITFDLDAIRRAHPDCRLARFRAMAGNTEPYSMKGANVFADLRVLVDGQSQFQRRAISGCTGAFPVAVTIRDGDRFLTLISSDGGNGIDHDWIVFGDPQLELVPAKPRHERER